MSGTTLEKKTKRQPRMFYGVNAASYLALAEINLRIEIAKQDPISPQKQLKNITRGTIQETLIHYLRFIRALTEEAV